MKKFLVTAALAAAAALPAHAAATPTNVGCSFSDLSGVAVSACSGFYSGNLLQGGAGNDADADVETGLQGLGLSAAATSTLKYLEKFDNNKSSTVNFSTLLNGDTIIGIHFGNGADRFKDADPKYNGQGGGTAFYRFNATNVDIFSLAASLGPASSGVALFQTGVTAPVPEPETYALMAAGLGVMGFVAHRCKKA